MADLMAFAALPDRLAELRERYPAAQVDMIAEVVREVLGEMRRELNDTQATLLAEVEGLGRTIAAAKAEIAALQADEITDSHIPSATDELDAIVAHTAAATDSILEVCETLDLVAGKLAKETASPVAADAGLRLQEATTRIYEACSFQDITGQRITKVVATLKAIEAKVAGIVATFGAAKDGAAQDGVAGNAAAAKPASERATMVLANGPQLPAAAMGQTDIDKLLASFE